LNILRTIHTIRYLKPRQAAWQVRHRLAGRPRVDLRPAPAVRERRGEWVEPAARRASMIGPDAFRLLNREGRVEGAEDWNKAGVPKLWLYNLHYFEDLTAGGWRERGEWHRELIGRWIGENPPGSGNGWEPYPISLRVVNWIKWVLLGNEAPAGMADSLAAQVRVLHSRPEYHLMGNHLWANGKALLFAGVFFEGEEAEVWRGKGLEILRRELEEQILPDGGHFERSPMYHALILEDLLDLVNLYSVYGLKPEEGWLRVIPRMQGWLEGMSHPDGKIALFNDAAFGVACSSRDLDAYAGRLGLGGQSPGPGGLTRFAESGYIRWVSGDAVLLIDAAPIGPDYIPGHAHADTLTFELSLFGRRVVVDSGTSTYDKDAERQRQRGTAAHNTVTVDGEDSSEVWGGFRVARRARPFDLEIRETTVSCAHDGYRRLPGHPVHRREWRLGAKELSILDRVEGGFGEAVARCHFHPDVEVTLSSDGTGTGKVPGGGNFSFRVGQGVSRLVDSSYHPEFNLSFPSRCLEIVLQGGEAELLLSWE
jgi:uncharacterized heparinase superfamily protein